jgi:tetratricopeptide (TPR) repeat protein
MAKPRPKTKPAEPAPAPKKSAAKTAAAGTAAKTAAKTAAGTAAKTAAGRAAGDPAVDALAKGLEALQRKDWPGAAKLFETAISESDRNDVTARARQFLTVARQQMGGQAPKGKEEGDQDPFLRAVFEKNRGNLAAALDLCRREGREQKDERFAYLAASLHALDNRMDEAVQALTRAIDLNPKNRVHAFHDPDFAEIRKNHRQLFGLS